MASYASSPGPLSPSLREFIAQLRSRPAAGAPPVALPQATGSIVRQVRTNADLVRRFESSARAAGIHVETVESAGLAARIVDVLGETSVDRTYFEPPLSRWGDALDRVRRAGIEVTDVACDEDLFSVGASITSVWRAVAETGSIVVRAGEQVARGASLIVPMHVAVIPAAVIVADLVDLFDLLEADVAMPSNVNIITGASKTADIEGQLVTGVHGPGRVVAIVVTDDLQPD